MQLKSSNQLMGQSKGASWMTSFALTVWYRLLTDMHAALTVWYRLLTDMHVAITVWYRLLTDMHVALTVWYRLLTDMHVALTVWYRLLTDMRLWSQARQQKLEELTSEIADAITDPGGVIGNRRTGVDLLNSL
jgi:uncharacterized membrane protein YagU involved in acid resistance